MSPKSLKDIQRLIIVHEVEATCEAWKTVWLEQGIGRSEFISMFCARLIAALVEAKLELAQLKPHEP